MSKELNGSVHNQPVVHFRPLFVVLAQIHEIFCLWTLIPSGKVVPMFHPTFFFSHMHSFLATKQVPRPMLRVRQTRFFQSLFKIIPNQFKHVTQSKIHVFTVFIETLENCMSL